MQISPKSLFPIITAGLIMGMIEAIVVVSLGTLIFSGDLSGYEGRGIGLALLSATISLVAIVLFSQGRGIFGSVQDVSCAIFAVVATNIAYRASQISPEETFMTVVVALALTTLLTGIFLWAVGYFKLAGFMRSLPYPVTGGLIAGTGWLLVVGGFDVVANNAPLHDYTQHNLFVHWLPALLFGLVLLLGLRRFDHPFLMPSLLLGAIIVFYAGVLLAGSSIAQIRADGWLMELPSGGLYNPIVPNDLAQVDWGLIFHETGSIVTILVMSGVLLILNINGLEVLIQQDIELNKELEMVGSTNILIGLLGGMVSFHTLSTTALGKQFGAQSRLFPLISALVCGMVMISGGQFLAYFPKPILGGLLIFIGLSFLVEWLVDTHLPRPDYGVVWLVLLTIALVGFLEGVLAGVLLTMLRFIIDYSQLDIIRHQFDLTTRHSKVNRSPEHEVVLDEVGKRVLIFELEGFIFFGTAYQLYNVIKGQIQGVNYLILDFRYVIRLDSSAQYSLAKLKQLCLSNNIRLLVSTAMPSIQTQLHRLELTYFPDLDYALEFVENALLDTELTPDKRASVISKVSQSFSIIMGDILIHYFKREDIEAGTVLAKQGENSDTMFFVEKGMLSVQLELPNAPNVRLRTITAGVLVGEVSWYRELPRTASIIADKPSTIYSLSRANLEQIHREHPEVAADLHLYMARILAGRLSDTTSALAVALK